MGTGRDDDSTHTGMLIIVLLLANFAVLGLARRLCTITNCQKIWKRVSRWLSGNNPRMSAGGEAAGDPDMEYAAVQMSDGKSDELW
jgi:hypothetical protein